MCASIGFDDLVSSHLIFRGEDRSLGSNPSISGARGKKGERSSVRCAGELPLTLEPEPLPQNTKVESAAFSF